VLHLSPSLCISTLLVLLFPSTSSSSTLTESYSSSIFFLLLFRSSSFSGVEIYIALLFSVSTGELQAGVAKPVLITQAWSSPDMARHPEQQCYKTLIALSIIISNEQLLVTVVFSMSVHLWGREREDHGPSHASPEEDRMYKADRISWRSSTSWLAADLISSMAININRGKIALVMSTNSFGCCPLGQPVRTCSLTRVILALNVVLYFDTRAHGWSEELQ